METLVLPVDAYSIGLAAELLKKGQLVAFPTETVYGLGANGLDAAAVHGIFNAKGRPQDNPLILHVAGIAGVPALVKEIPDEARILMEAFWPGPLSVVMEASALVPDAVRAGLPTVAVRCPANMQVRELISQCGFPLAAPSANKSGKPSPTTAQAVLEDMAGRIPLILDGGPCSVGLESTVITVCAGKPRILRPGGITKEMIELEIGPVDVDEATLKPLGEGQKAASPGMKYKHYAPEAELTVVGGERAKVAEEIRRLYDRTKAAGGNPAVLAWGASASMYGGRAVYPLGAGNNEESKGAELYAVLRRLDADGRTHAFAEAVEASGMGLAVMNRLLRAAGFRTIKV